MAIEDGDAPTVAEIESLSDLYGIDADTLGDQPITVAAQDSLGVLALLDEFRDVSAESRARIIGAARAARDAVELATLLGEPSGLAALRKRRRAPPPTPHEKTAPWSEGVHYAKWWRKELGLGRGPVPSMRDLLTDQFPEVMVIHADLGDPSVSGLTFADPLRGPTIVLNVFGKNESPLVRRFSLAHELAHLLVAFPRAEPLATLSGFREDARLAVEQRANAFAVRFLCPESELKALAREEKPKAAADILGRRWGLHFEAARLYLDRVAHVEVPRSPLPSSLAVHALWGSSEDRGLEPFPLQDVPPERRTEVARRAALAYSSGVISRDRCARLLGVTPADEIERLLSFFSLDVPEE